MNPVRRPLIQVVPGAIGQCSRSTEGVSRIMQISSVILSAFHLEAVALIINGARTTFVVFADLLGYAQYAQDLAEAKKKFKEEGKKIIAGAVCDVMYFFSWLDEAALLPLGQAALAFSSFLLGGLVVHSALEIASASRKLIKKEGSAREQWLNIAIAVMRVAAFALSMYFGGWVVLVPIAFFAILQLSRILYQSQDKWLWVKTEPPANPVLTPGPATVNVT